MMFEDVIQSSLFKLSNPVNSRLCQCVTVTMVVWKPEEEVTESPFVSFLLKKISTSKTKRTFEVSLWKENDSFKYDTDKELNNWRRICLAATRKYCHWVNGQLSAPGREESYGRLFLIEEANLVNADQSVIGDSATKMQKFLKSIESTIGQVGDIKEVQLSAKGSSPIPLPQVAAAHEFFGWWDVSYAPPKVTVEEEVRFHSIYLCFGCSNSINRTDYEGF